MTLIINRRLYNPVNFGLFYTILVILLYKCTIIAGAETGKTLHSEFPFPVSLTGLGHASTVSCQGVIA